VVAQHSLTLRCEKGTRERAGKEAKRLFFFPGKEVVRRAVVRRTWDGGGLTVRVIGSVASSSITHLASRPIVVCCRGWDLLLSLLEHLPTTLTWAPGVRC